MVSPTVITDPEKGTPPEPEGLLPNNNENPDHSNMVMNYSNGEPIFSFISEKPNKFSITQYALIKSRPGSKHSWSKFVLQERVTVAIKTPKYLGFPTINVFLYTKLPKQSRKQLVNITSTFTTRFPFPMSTIIASETVWFMEAFENLLKRNNIEYDYTLLWNTVSKTTYTTPPPQQYLDYVVYPLATHMVFDSNSQGQYKGYPLSRARTFEQLISYGKYSHPPLVEWLKTKYTLNQLNQTYLFLLSICTHYSQEQLLGVLKVAEMVTEQTGVYSLFRLSSQTKMNVSTVKQLRGLFSKISAQTLMNMITEIGVALIRIRNHNPKSVPSIPLPDSTILNLWSQNYRKIQPIKKELVSLETKDIAQYLETNVLNVGEKNSEKKYDEYVKRLNKLQIITKPVTDLQTIPAPFTTIARIRNLPDPVGSFTRIPVLFSYWNVVLQKFAPDLADPLEKNLYFSPEYIWGLTVELFERIDAGFVNLFTRAKTPINHDVIETLVNSQFESLQWQVLLSFRKQWPVNIIKMISYGFSPELAFQLTKNRIPFKQVYETFVIDDKLMFPETWVKEAYGLNKSQPVVDDIF